MKFFELNEIKFNQTIEISLVSSFLASIFIGKFAPIDFSDASGMNLFNIKTKKCI